MINPELIPPVHLSLIDLLESMGILDEEHIAGCMPAAARDREQARQDFYSQLRAQQIKRPRRRRARIDQPELDLDLPDGFGDCDE